MLTTPTHCLQKELKLPDCVELSAANPIVIKVKSKAAVLIEGRGSMGDFILIQSADDQLLDGEDREFPK